MRLSRVKARAYRYFTTVVPNGLVAVALTIAIALALQLVPVLQPPASAAVSTSVKTSSITPKGGALKLPEQPVVASPPPGIDLTKLPGVTKTAKSDKAPILPAAADKLLPPDPKNPVAMAVAEARRTGNKAEVAGRTTETEITWANPDASLTTEIGAGPVRIKKGTSFVPADPTLVLANGVIEPKAAQGSIKLSAGGAGGADLASLEAAGKKVTMGLVASARNVRQR